MNKLNEEEMKSKSNEELAQHRTKIAEDRTELAKDRTEIAHQRNDMAENRTLQAAQRTYAAWVRTGFTIAGAGWTLGQALQGTEGRNMALLLGGALIILGLMCFIFGWIGFRSVYNYLRKAFEDAEEKKYPFKTNFAVVSILSIALVVVFIFGFGILLF